MSITEYERNQLFTWFEEHMGKDRANAMMSLLPPVGWADVATKRDLDALSDRLDARFERIDDRFERMEERFERIDERFGMIDERFGMIDERFGMFEERTADRFKLVEQRLDTMATKADLHELRSDLQRTFVTWMFASQATVIAAIGLFLGLFR